MNASLDWQHRWQATRKRWSFLADPDEVMGEENGRQSVRSKGWRRDDERLSSRRSKDKAQKTDMERWRCDFNRKGLIQQIHIQQNETE